MKKKVKKAKISHKDNLHAGKLTCKIPNVRAIIKARMKTEKVSAYKLAKLTGISHQTVNNFVGGTHEMRSDKLAMILAVLGLEIRPKE
jgi:predicted XRE-type DNA-binding protein